MCICVKCAFVCTLWKKIFVWSVWKKYFVWSVYLCELCQTFLCKCVFLKICIFVLGNGDPKKIHLGRSIIWKIITRNLRHFYFFVTRKPRHFYYFITWKPRHFCFFISKKTSHFFKKKMHFGRSLLKFITRKRSYFYLFITRKQSNYYFFITKKLSNFYFFITKKESHCFKKKETWISIARFFDICNQKTNSILFFYN